MSAVSHVGEVIQNALRAVYGFDNVDWYEDDVNTLGVVTSGGQFVEISMHECYSAGITKALSPGRKPQSNG